MTCNARVTPAFGLGRERADEIREIRRKRFAAAFPTEAERVAYLTQRIEAARATQKSR
jgi:hypothetical protein